MSFNLIWLKQKCSTSLETLSKQQISQSANIIIDLIKLDFFLYGTTYGEVFKELSAGVGKRLNYDLNNEERRD